jgi:hypothetical protein
MRPRVFLLIALFPLCLALTSAAEKDPASAETVTWKKTILDPVFRAEGVAVADVNRDGKIDVLNGEAWYEAPKWKRHEIQPLGKYNGETGYSHTFACWAEDLNGDGWPDLIVIDFPGNPCYWLENPKGEDGHWKKHIIWHSACNETPQYMDLLGNGKRVLIMGFQPKGKENMGQMAYFTPGEDPTALWQMHPISEPSAPGKEVPGTQRFSHGLGIGDINGDGKLDVICTGGWWEQPTKVDDTPWKFHPGPLGPACADMFAYDVDGDGKADVISSSAHNYGIWWYQHKPSDGGSPGFVQRALFPHLVSETHAMHCVDINGDGLKDLVTGKRFWSHGHREPDADKPAMLYWFEAKRGGDGMVKFTPHVIDDDSGIGTQFVVADINGDKLPDVVVSNKKGTFVFEQQRKK